MPLKMNLRSVNCLSTLKIAKILKCKVEDIFKLPFLALGIFKTLIEMK